MPNLTRFHWVHCAVVTEARTDRETDKQTGELALSCALGFLKGTFTIFDVVTSVLFSEIRKVIVY